MIYWMKRIKKFIKMEGDCRKIRKWKENKKD